MIPTDAVLLCLHLNASHRWRGKPAYQAAVGAARSLHLAGASVFLVDLSYGAHHRLRDARSEYLFVDIPVVVEIVDGRDRIDRLLAELASMESGGLATVEPVRIVSYPPHTDVANTGGSNIGPAEAAASAAEATSDRPTDSHSGASLMALEGVARRVTVYIGNTDTWNGRHLASAIVQRCREMGIAGATASLGVMGFGRHSVIHRTHVFGLSEDVPEKVEIVDRPERIAEILPVLEEMVDGGLILVQDVQVVRHAHHSPPA